MSRHTLSRIDRVAQMSMQEEIIARKKLEIIEKQKTTELAKQVVAAQLSGKGSSKKDKLAAAKTAAAATTDEPLGPKNSFNNDGSFFENFKKITDAAKKAQKELEEKMAPPPVLVENVVAVVAEVPALAYEVEGDHTNDPEQDPIVNNMTIEQSVDAFIAEFHPVAAVLCAKPPPPPPPPLQEPAFDDNTKNDPPNATGYLDFDERGKPPPPPFSTAMPNTTSRPPNTPPFLDMRVHPPAPNQPPPFAIQNPPPPLGFQPSNPPPTNVRPPFCGPPPMIKDFPTIDPTVPPPRPSDFKTDKQPLQMPTFNASSMPPSLVADQNSNTQASSSPPIIPSRGQNDSPSDRKPFDSRPFSNEPPPSQSSAPRFNEPMRSNPFDRQFTATISDEPQFPGGRFQAAPPKSSPSYTNPFSQPQNSNAHFPSNQSPNHFQPQDNPNNFQQQRFNQAPPPSNLVQFRNAPPPSSSNPFAKSQPPPTDVLTPPPIAGGSQFRTPPPSFPSPSASSNPLHSIPPPKPMQLNKIPPPRELDLNAIPEPTLNLAAIKVPEVNEISRDHEFIPTSVESLVELVAENGDEYEDRLRSRKIDMHSSLWFLSERGSHAYRAYRKKVLAVRYNNDEDGEAPEDDFADVAAAQDHDDRVLQSPPGSEFGQLLLKRSSAAGASPMEGTGFNTTDCDMRIGQAMPMMQQNQQLPDLPQQQEQKPSSDVDPDKYDPADMFQEDDDDDNADNQLGDAGDGFNAAIQAAGSGSKSSERTYDSDSEYMSAAKERNFGQMKRKRDVDERRPFMDASSDSDSADEDTKNADNEAGGSSPANRKKRSRWGEKVAGASSKVAAHPFAVFASGMPSTSAGAGKPMLSLVTRTDPALLAYARQSYGTENLDEETWRKCEDHFKVNLLYQDMLRKRNEMDRLARAGRQKYEYDSDEDVQGGTWEHKLRNAEMEATSMWSDALTKQAEGKHHIGDFLPPEELKKFMEKYESQQTNREPDLSDYREYKLREDNKGFQMLQKLGWKEGQGLGFEGAGIVDPVNKAQQRDSNQGLGTMNASVPDFGDNEYDAYRKRMMLAYRFRPNPLNNPRRSYY